MLVHVNQRCLALTTRPTLEDPALVSFEGVFYNPDYSTELIVSRLI